MMNLQLDPDEFRPLIQTVVGETVRQIEAERAKIDGQRLAYSEPEAARLIGLEPNQLRDERLRGRIRASAIVGRRIRYMREDLVAYLLERRWEKKDG